MALSKRSLSQAKQLLQQILDSNVDVIATRATLDKKIELVKFPYLKHKHEKIQKNKTIYVSSQYDPIRYWLINNRFLTSHKDNCGRYQYRVNRDTIKAFLQSDSNIEQSNNIKNENKKVMTRKEKVFRHIEDNGNAMRYTDIIKFAFEDLYGKGTFDKKKNRGFYSCAFNYYSYWSARFGDRRKNVGAPRGHFVTPTRNGHLVKLSNGLWSVHRPLGWKREDITTIPVSEDSYKTVLDHEEYQSMCEVLAKYSVTPDQLDSLATDYYHKKDGDGASCYHWAYYDLLEKSGAISDTTKALQKEIDELADRIIAEDMPQVKYQKYVVISISDSYHEGIFTASELETFFTEKDPEEYMIIEAGNMVTLEKKVTTTFTIK
jgi:hypothetical protein